MNKTNHPPLQAQLADYFNGTGFDRWSAIYGDRKVSYIRRTVREGHEMMLGHAVNWLTESSDGGTLLDAGCGTGLFSVAMAKRGFNVTGIDIAPRMAAAAADAADKANISHNTTFQSSDIQQINTQFDTVACLDVLVHYPRGAFGPLCTHLAKMSKQSLIITYAPYNRLLAGLHWVGGFFPKGQRRTEIQMIPDHLVESALAAGGMSVKRTVNISKGFYHIKLLEAERK